MKFLKHVRNIICLYIIPIISLLFLTKLYQTGEYATIFVAFSIFGLKKIYDSTLKIKTDTREKIIISVVSLVISLFIVYGTLINQNYNDYSYSFKGELLLIIFSLYSISIVLFNVVKLIYLSLKNNSISVHKYKKRWKYLFFVIMVAAWIPYFYNFYPALMSPDSLSQYGQSIGAVTLSNHHPLLHTFLISIFSHIGIAINNNNMGMAFYSIFQILTMALVFTYELDYIYKKTCNIVIPIIFLVIYSLVPVFGFYSVTIWKDVLFGVFGTLMMLQLYKIITEKDFKIIDGIILFMSVILTALFRTNGLYAVLLLGIVALIVMKQRRVKIMIYVLIPIVLSFIVVGPVYSSIGAKDTEFTENLGVFIRQIYSVIYNEGNIDNKSKEFLDKLVDQTEALDVYSPYDDHIKAQPSYNEEFIENNKVEFIKTYFRLGFRNKKIYLVSYIKATYGVWYPEAQGYLAQKWPIPENEYNLKSDDSFDSLHITKWFDFWNNAPVFRYFMSEAFYIWLLLIGMAVVIINKKYKEMLVLLFPFLYWMTIMVATPLSYQPRYMFIMHCSLPVIALCSVESFTKVEKKSTKKTKSAK